MDREDRRERDREGQGSGGLGRERDREGQGLRGLGREGDIKGQNRKWVRENTVTLIEMD